MKLTAVKFLFAGALLSLSCGSDEVERKLKAKDLKTISKFVVADDVYPSGTEGDLKEIISKFVDTVKVKHEKTSDKETLALSVDSKEYLSLLKGKKFLELLNKKFGKASEPLIKVINELDEKKWSKLCDTLSFVFDAKFDEKKNSLALTLTKEEALKFFKANLKASKEYFKAELEKESGTGTAIAQVERPESSSTESTEANKKLDLSLKVVFKIFEKLETELESLLPDSFPVINFTMIQGKSLVINKKFIESNMMSFKGFYDFLNKVKNYFKLTSEPSNPEADDKNSDSEKAEVIDSEKAEAEISAE